MMITGRFYRLVFILLHSMLMFIGQHSIHALGVIKPSDVGLQRWNPKPSVFRVKRSIFKLDARLQSHESLSKDVMVSNPSRRQSLIQIITTLLTWGVSSSTRPAAHGALGTLPEFDDTNAILQGITLDVTQEEQLQDMISFLIEGFNFKILRQRTNGTVTDMWMGYGPEQLSIPDDFIYPMSIARYGGHSSIHLHFDSSSTKSFYEYSKNSTNTTSTAPGDNIAFLQVAVPSYRISQMIKYGGNILDAYGIVNVISPCGLPMRGIIGIRPDPIMFLAINCKDVEQSREFYEQQLGFVQQPYPYARPSNGTGQFEPPQPKGSVYLSPSRNSMGLLLLPFDNNKDKKGSFKFWEGMGTKTMENKVELKVNPVIRSVNIVYSPLESDSSPMSENSPVLLRVRDPSLVPLEFVPLKEFEKEERTTRVLLDESLK